MNNNPLKQYFRRPAIYIRLPSQGVFYTPDVIEIPESGEIPVFPMTAIDEITCRTPDAVFNGQAVADVIKSCIPCVKQPWKINSIDFDTILLAIKIASLGETTTLEGDCPACKSENSFEVNLVNLLNSGLTNNYNQPLIIRDLTIKFRPLIYTEINQNNMMQYDLQKMFFAVNQIEDEKEKLKEQTAIIKKINESLNEVIANTIESIKTPETEVTDRIYIKEFVDNCDSQTNKLIKDYSVSLKSAGELKPFKLKCINCGEKYEQNLSINVSDFFV